MFKYSPLSWKTARISAEQQTASTFRPFARSVLESPPSQPRLICIISANHIATRVELINNQKRDRASTITKRQDGSTKITNIRARLGHLVIRREPVDSKRVQLELGLISNNQSTSPTPKLLSPPSPDVSLSLRSLASQNYFLSFQTLPPAVLPTKVLAPTAPFS